MRNIKVLWGIVAVLLIAVVILSSVLTAHYVDSRKSHPNPDSTQQAGQTQPVALIGDQVITRGHLEEQLLHKYGTELLDQMIDQHIIRLEAEALGIQVSDSEVQQELVRMQQGYDSEKQFWESMREQLGLSQEQLRSDLRDKLLGDKITTHSIVISDSTVDAYMQAHPEEFKPRVELRLYQIVTENKDGAQKALKDLAQGMEFSQVARERSLDDATRNSGGDMGWVELDDPFIPAAVMKAAKLLKPGQAASQPVESGGQYVILYLKDRREKSRGTAAELREQIRRELALREAPPLGETLGKLRQKWNVKVIAPQKK